MFTSLLGLPLFPWTPTTAFALGDVEREQLPLPQPLRGERPRPVGARVPRDPGALPGHPVGELARGRPQRRGLLLDERGDPEHAEREGRRLPDRARAGDRQPSSACPIPDGSRSACSGAARRRARPTRACCPTRASRSSSGATTCRTATTATGWPTRAGHSRASTGSSASSAPRRTPRTRLGDVKMRDRLARPRRAARQAIEPRDPREDGPRQPPVPRGAVARPGSSAICRANPTHQRGRRERRLRRARPLEPARRPRRSRRRCCSAASRRAPTPPRSAADGHPGLSRAGRARVLEPFDVNRPVDTPSGLQDSNKVRSALAGAVPTCAAPGSRSTPRCGRSRRTARRARPSTAGPVAWAYSKRSARRGTGRATGPS